MISSSDSYNTYDIGQYYVILPTDAKGNYKTLLKNLKQIKFLLASITTQKKILIFYP